MLAAVKSQLLPGLKYSGVKLHDLAEVRAEVRRAVASGIEVEFVFDVLFLKLPVEGRGSCLKTIFVGLSTVEIDG